MTQSQQLRKLAAQSATAFLVAALCAFPLYIDKFSNLGDVTYGILHHEYLQESFGNLAKIAKPGQSCAR